MAEDDAPKKRLREILANHRLTPSGRASVALKCAHKHFAVVREIEAAVEAAVEAEREWWRSFIREHQQRNDHAWHDCLHTLLDADRARWRGQEEKSC